LVDPVLPRREGRLRDRALFDLAIDSKLRGCDLVKIKIGTLVIGPEVRSRAIVVQQKTGRPVQFELMADARASLLAWLERRGGTIDAGARRFTPIVTVALAFLAWLATGLSSPGSRPGRSRRWGCLR
jgi:site-specific recombinase XerC